MIIRRKKLASAVMQALNASVIATLAATSVNAQQTPASPPPEKLEKIEVTGSRIPAAVVEGTSPVTVIDAQTIKTDGVRSVENLLNNLPQVFADQGGNVSNGATGTATVNLRNLGATRTLVLVNGRRLPAGSPREAAPDLNQIPAPLIKRVEILTGGASAVYGSDAVAGVVNFIMNDKFEGAQFEVNQSFYNHQQDNPVASIVRARSATNPTQFQVPGDKSSDGKITDFSMLLGGNFANNKGNGTLFFSYKKEDALRQSERDYSACTLGSTAAGGFNCAGSGTSFPGQFINLATGAARTVANAQGGTRAYVGANDAFNFGPYNYYQRPSERYGANASVTYDVFDAARVYADFSFHDDRTVAQIAPSGLFGLVTTVGFNNPLLSADWRRDLALVNPGDTADLLILRRNIEGGGRQDDIRHTSYRFNGGVKGEFAKVWNYDVFAQSSKVVYQSSYLNDFSVTRAGRAMNVVADANGNAVCQSVVDGSDPNCVPYNIWRLGGVTPEALAYLQTPGFQKGFTSQQIQGATLSADLTDYGFKLPMAKNGLGVAFGLERRVEKLELETDQAFSTGDLFGQGGPTIGLGGSYTVKEIFGELRVPIIEGRQFAELLSVNGSARNSDYNTGQKADSFGLGLEWSPVKAARVRGSYQKAVRAANVIELFTAQGLGLYDNDEDPCAGATPTRTLAECQRTGVTAAQYGRILDNPAGQYNQLLGGNPSLKPETSKSSTLGLVLTPMRDLAATVDYFNIKVKDTIGVTPATITLQQCLDTGNPQFCSLITRDSLGTLWATPAARIIATNLNIGETKTEGFDIGVNYAHKIGSMGSLAWSFNGTLLKKFEVEPIKGLGSYDCKGLYGPNCGTPLPEWRHKLRTTWMSPWNVDLSLTWRFFDSVELDRTSSNPLLTGNVNPVDRTLGKRDYFDLAATWRATKNFTITGGVNNLADRDPPLSAQVGAGFGNGNTYPQVYDALGRRIFLNATAKF